MNHFPPTSSIHGFPGLVTIDEATGQMVACREYHPDEIGSLRDCIVAAIERNAEVDPLFVPCTPRESTRTVYLLDRAPAIDDPAVVDLAIRATGYHVLWTRPAIVTVEPESREEKDFMAALRAHWSRVGLLPLMEIDLATVAATRGLERRATHHADALRCMRAAMDYCLADEIDEDAETAERRGDICFAEGLDVESVEAGAKTITARIVDAILGTPATNGDLVL